MVSEGVRVCMSMCVCMCVCKADGRMYDEDRLMM